MFASAVGGASAHGAMPPRHTEPPPMNEVAKLLGMNGTELTGQLRSGKTLDSLASERGLSSAELLKSIEAELTAKRPEGAPELSATQLTEMAQHIASGTPPSPAGGQHDAAAGEGAGGTFAQILGVQPSVLLEELEHGTDISSLLPQLGYTSDGSSSQSTDAAGIAFNGYA